MERANFDIARAQRLAVDGLRFAGSVAMRVTESSRRKIATVVSPEQAEEARLAFIDYDTGAANKRAFSERVEELVKVGEPFAAVVVDIDKFKKVNDQIGHGHADDIIKQFVSGINSHIREEDTFFSGTSLFRTGGDEFILLAPMIAREDPELTYDQRLDSFLNRLNNQYFSGQNFTSPGGVVVPISATAVGCVLYPEAASEFPEQFNDLFVDMLAQKQQP